MATISTTPTVVLTREQRQACCDLAWDEINEGCTRNEEERLRLTMAGARMFDALDWRNDDPGREPYVLPVDEEIAWLAGDLFEPVVREYATAEAEQEIELRDHLGYLHEEARAYYLKRPLDERDTARALISATEAILAAVA